MTLPSGFTRIAVFSAIVLGFSFRADAQIVQGTSSTTPAAQAKATDPFNRDSPQSSVVSFLEAYHARNYARASRYLDLRTLPDDRRFTEGPTLAKELGGILDGDTRFDVAALSRSPEGDPENGQTNRQRIDTFTLNGRSVELDLERVTLNSGLSVWLVSAASIPLIGELTFHLSESPVERHLPAVLVAWKWMDTPIWRWIALLLLAVALALISGIVSRVTLALAEPALQRIAPRIEWSRLEMFAGPVRALLSIAVFRAGMAAVPPAPLPRLYLERLLTLLFYFAVAWLIAKILDLSVLHLNRVLGTRYQSLSHSVLPVAARATKLAVLVLALISTFDSWGYNTRTILATLGLGGLAIALAAQKTVENLFGGVAVISDRPVMVGDYCKFGSQSGTVEDIGLRSTRIRTPDRTLITVPNGQFSTMSIENFSRRDKLLLNFTLNLKRDTTPDQVRKVLGAIASILTNSEKIQTGDVPVRFAGVGTYSLDIELEAYILTQDYNDFLRLRQDLLLRILDAVAAAGTALALPTQATVNYGGPAAGGSDSAPERDLALNGR